MAVFLASKFGRTTAKRVVESVATSERNQVKVPTQFDADSGMRVVEHCFLTH